MKFIGCILIVMMLSGCSTFNEEYDKCREHYGRMACYFNAALWTPAIEAAEIKKENSK